MVLFFTAINFANMLTAISSGPSAPMSRPMGISARTYDVKPSVIWTSDPVFNGSNLILPPFSAAILKLS